MSAKSSSTGRSGLRVTGARLRGILDGCKLGVLSSFSSMFSTGGKGKGSRVVFTIECTRNRTAGGGGLFACTVTAKDAGSGCLTGNRGFLSTLGVTGANDRRLRCGRRVCGDFSMASAQHRTAFVTSCGGGIRAGRLALEKARIHGGVNCIGTRKDHVCYNSCVVCHLPLICLVLTRVRGVRKKGITRCVGVIHGHTCNAG